MGTELQTAAAAHLPSLSKAKIRRGQFSELFAPEFVRWALPRRWERPVNQPRYSDEPRYVYDFETQPPPECVTMAGLDEMEALIRLSAQPASDAEIREMLVRLKVNAAPSSLSAAEMGIWADEFVTTLQIENITRGELGRAYHAWVLDSKERFMPNPGALIEKARRKSNYIDYESEEDKWLERVQIARNWLTTGNWRGTEQLRAV